LDGEASFTVGEQTIDGSPGSFVYIPRNTRHTFDMRIKAVRVLNTYSPAGPGEFAKE
jgi:quercetin dioxygenase-like cupin family protein